MSRSITWLVLCIAFALAGCGRQEAAPPPAAGSPSAAAPPAAPPPVAAPAPFGIGAIELGNQIGADERVLAPAQSFAPGDTIYASISTQGETQGVVLAARWSYEDGQTVAESTETVASAGPTVVEFHIGKPDGWPAGRYRVEVTANGQPAGSREFEVR
jgi:hypothetical protein